MRTVFEMSRHEQIGVERYASRIYWCANSFSAPGSRLTPRSKPLDAVLARLDNGAVGKFVDEE